VLPEPILKSPELPLLALPELNTNIPLLPIAPALALLIEIIPLLVAVPSPLDKLIAPPVSVVLRPPEA
jgi:hypothetical protein